MVLPVIELATSYQRPNRVSPVMANERKSNRTTKLFAYRSFKLALRFEFYFSASPKRFRQSHCSGKEYEIQAGCRLAHVPMRGY